MLIGVMLIKKYMYLLAMNIHGSGVIVILSNVLSDANVSDI